MEVYLTLEFTDSFLDSYAAREFSASDRAAFQKALRLLDDDDKHPSLRIHQLKDELAGTWSASATQSLRITFWRLEGARKRVIACSRHYES